MKRDQIKQILVAHGFKLHDIDGVQDLKPYVYEAVLAVLDVALEPDSFWDAANPEDSHSRDLVWLIEDILSSCGAEIVGETVEVMCAKSLPNIRVKVTECLYDDDGSIKEILWEIVS